MARCAPCWHRVRRASSAGLKEAYLINAAGALKTRGEKSYLFDFEPPSADQLARADAGEVVLIQDWPNNEFRALVNLDAFPDRLLYVSREVDGSILGCWMKPSRPAQLYQQLEATGARSCSTSACLYLGFAVILIVAAVWGGLWFAERLSRPVGRLAAAAAACRGRAIWTCRSSRRRATTKLPCWGACSTR